MDTLTWLNNFIGVKGIRFIEATGYKGSVNTFRQK